jgi:hypothetical protein
MAFLEFQTDEGKPVVINTDQIAMVRTDKSDPERSRVIFAVTGKDGVMIHTTIKGKLENVLKSLTKS